MLDLYCERMAPGLLAEPLNASTNLAFLIAAWAAWCFARRSHVFTADVRILIALAVVIGCGSALFHTLATGWARVFDELPILLFQLWFLWLYVRRLMAKPPATAAVVIVAYLAAAYSARLFPHLLNGSLVYAPALIVMSGLSWYHWRRPLSGRGLLPAATAVLLLSLVFRSIDGALCPWLPMGTHFLWHLLNGAVLYLSMRVIILNLPGRRS